MQCSCYCRYNAETVSSAGSVWYVGSFNLCCEILLLLNVAESVWTELSFMWNAVE